MRLNPFKTLTHSLFALTLIGLNACVNSTAIQASDTDSIPHNEVHRLVDNVADSTHDVTNQVTPAAKPVITFYDYDEAVEALAREDDYIKALSTFDLNLLFGSEDKPDTESLKEYYSNYVLEWDEDSIHKVTTAVNHLHSKIADLNLNQPDTYKFILIDGEDAIGAAYTREDYIVLPKNFINSLGSQRMINRLVAHEFFHVYSRFNKNDRDKLFAPIHFYESPKIVLSDKYDSLRITNPDAPHNNFVIDLDFEGETLTFAPVLTAIASHNKIAYLPFHMFMNDGLLAVAEVDGVMRQFPEDNPIFTYRDNTNYNELVKLNSTYITHPEEVSAENFALWVTDGKIEHQQPVDDLIDAMRSIR